MSAIIKSSGRFVCFHTTNRPLQGSIESKPRPTFLGDLSPLVLSHIQVWLLWSYMPKLLEEETLLASKQLLQMSQVWIHHSSQSTSITKCFKHAVHCCWNIKEISEFFPVASGLWIVCPTTAQIANEPGDSPNLSKLSTEITVKVFGCSF